MTDNTNGFPELSHHAKPSNKRASYVTYASLASAALFIAVCFFGDKYSGIFGIIAMCFFTVAIFFYTKYMAAEYIYDLTTDTEGLPLFVVRTRTGRRETTLARLDIYAIKKVERLTRAELGKRKSDTGVARYTYTPTFRPDEVTLLTVRSRYERSDVVIEAPKELSELIDRYAERAREIYKEEE